jgi:hypothetical protein
MKPDLVAYALNALEPEEHRAVEEVLAASSAARQELAAIQACLQPLVHDAEIEPPANLLADTLKRVVAHRCRRVVEPPPQVTLPRRGRPSLFTWRHANALVAAGIVLVLCALIPSALLYARHREGIIACADNLHQFHAALMQYSQGQDGYLPRPEKSGQFSSAAVYTVALRDAGLWNPNLQTTCPANRSGHRATPPPTHDELQARCIAISPEGLRQMYESLGGCYGYHLGYEDEQGRFMAIRRDLGDHVSIMADRPPRERETPQWQVLNSPNHAGLGQNVLYLGGHVRFVRDRVIGGDDIYLNRVGRLAVGRGSADVVIGPGEARPYPDQD